MSISFGMILFGSILIVAGWQNRSLSALARGDSTRPKGAVLAGAAGASSAPSGPSGPPQGKDGGKAGKAKGGAGGGAGGAW